MLQLANITSQRNMAWFFPQGITRKESFHIPARASCLGGFVGRICWGIGGGGWLYWLFALKEELVVARLAMEYLGFEKVSSYGKFDCALPVDQVAIVEIDILSGVGVLIASSCRRIGEK